MTESSSAKTKADPLTPSAFGARLLWVAVRLILVVWAAREGSMFIYQGF